MKFTITKPSINTPVIVLVLVVLIALSSVNVNVDAYTPTVMTRRSTMTMKRGRGSFNKEIGDGAGRMSSSSSSFSSGTGLSNNSNGINWIQTNSKVEDLPQEEGKVGLIETGAFLLVDKATNPNGAVSVVKYGPETYCFSVNCPKCKIPMIKAKTLPPNEETQNKAPRISCDFCKSTFNLKTGAPVKPQEAAGILGSLAKAVMSAQDTAPLPVCTLGEKNGKVLFTMQ